MGVTATDIHLAVRAVRLSGQVLCVHASLRSFGWVVGGARTVVDALLAEGCTVLVPTFSSVAYEVWPDPPDRIEGNGLGPHPPAGGPPGARCPYSPAAEDVDPHMGAVAAAVLATPGRVRGDHPVNSFSAVGPAAHELVAGQRPQHVYAPLETLAATGGAVLLMGVGLERMTLLHLAEQRAGRAPFIRWANGSDGRIMRVHAGGCSEGFSNLSRALAGVTTHVPIGLSQWAVLPAAAALEAAVAALRADPAITHCSDRACERCNDAVRGGPRGSA